MLLKLTKIVVIMNNKKVLIFDNSLKSFLGFRNRLLTELNRTAHVEIATVVDVENRRIPKELKIHNVGIARTSVSIKKLFFEFVVMLKLIKKIRPTIILSFTLRCALIIGLCCFFSRKNKSVAVITGLGNFFQTKNIIIKIIQKFIIKIILNNDKIIVLNKEILEIFKKANPILIEGEGVDLQKFSFSKKSEIRKFIFVGRLLYDKGIIELIEAFKISQAKYGDIHLKLVLSVDEHNPAKLDINSIKKMLDGNMSIILNCENVMEELNKADCFIFPSYHEGFSIALSEASASGLILIASNIEGCRQIVTDENGILVHPMSQNSIVNAIDSLMQLKQSKIEHMSISSRRQAVEKLDQNKQAKYFYNEII